MLREWLSFMNSNPQCMNYIYIHLFRYKPLDIRLVFKKFVLQIYGFHSIMSNLFEKALA